MLNQKQQKDFVKRAEAYLKNDKDSLKKNKLTMKVFVNFPGKRKPPLLSKIALRIVSWQGGILDSVLEDLKNK